MLQQLRLENFRCFKDHSISFGPLSILVGRNNAGKSTIVDALRLVSIVTNRYRSSNYQEVPAWLDTPKRERGIAPSLRGMQFNLDTIFHRYADPPAMVTATFDSRESTKIYIGPEPAIHAVLFDSGGHPVPSRFEANALTFPQVNILPQISPLLREEELLTLTMSRQPCLRRWRLCISEMNCFGISQAALSSFANWLPPPGRLSSSRPRDQK